MKLTTRSSKYLIVVLGLTWGCQKDSADSTTQSLDNFAGGSFEINQCGPKKASDRKPAFIKNAGDKLALVKQTYSALPANLHERLFKTSGGILLGNTSGCQNALSEVQKDFVGENNRGGEGCWEIKGDKVSLTLPKDDKWIKHSMLRLSGYVYTELVAVQAAKSEDATLNSGAAAFRSQRQRLAQAFVADLGGRSKLDDRMKKLTSAGKTFGNFVVAESIDSYYCNPKTNASFRKNFPKTYKVFTSGANNLRQDLGKAFFE